MRKKIQLLLTILFIAATSSAQEKLIENIVEVELRNAGSIFSNELVVGHYMFYKTDRVNRKTYNYEMQIFDENLNKIGTHTLESSKYLFLIDVTYNQKTLLLKLYDAKNDKIIFQQLDNKASLISEQKREVGKIEEMQIRQLQTGKGSRSINLFPVADYGYADFRNIKNKNYGYTIDFYPSQSGKKWSYSSDQNADTHLFPTMIYGDADIMMNIVMEKDGLLSKEAKLILMALDTQSGDLLFKKPVKDNQYELSPLNGFKIDNDGNFYLLGNYFSKGSNILTSKSLGLFQFKINKSGEILEKHYSSWSQDVSKHLTVDEKGKFEDFGYVFFHDFIADKSGNLYAIGEQYKKQYKGLGFDIVIKDMMIFKFDKSFNLKEIKIVGKEETDIRLPNAAMLSPQMLSMMVKAYDGYDYEFTTTNNDNSVISIGYLDYIDVKGGSDKYIYGNIAFADGKGSTDKIDVAEVKEKKKFKVLPSQAGSIVVLEYFEKEKQISIKKVKLNY